MESGAHLEQAGDSSAERDLSFRGFGDPGQNLQQRALASAVSADDADDLTLRNLERHAAKRPELAPVGLCCSPDQAEPGALGVVDEPRGADDPELIALEDRGDVDDRTGRRTHATSTKV